MSQEFVGVGFSFPISLDAEGRVVLVREEDTIRRSIWLILSTALGERSMRPDFGCGLQDYVFSDASGHTLGRLANAVEAAIVKWEPRVALESLEIRQDPADPTRLLIELTVQVLAISTSLNMVYPFYLEGGGDG